jgi:hypothetical protein
MPVQLNHTIVEVRDPEKSAAFLADLLGCQNPPGSTPAARHAVGEPDPVGQPHGCHMV